jgi:parallel beta-helix repeat protein
MDLFRKIVFLTALTLVLVFTLAFADNVQQVRGQWTGEVTIRADGSINPSDAPIITGDNITYTLTGNITAYRSSGARTIGITVERNNVIINGAGFTLYGDGSYQSAGIELQTRSNVTVKNVEITNFDFGIYMSSSSGCVITHNKLVAGGAIFLSESNYNNITSNIILRNKPCGIHITSSSGNIIKENIIAESLREVYQGEPEYEGSGAGVVLVWSNNNILINNNISSNSRSGLVLLGSCSNNRIFHNNFINNPTQIFIEDSASNLWDDGYLSGGNYWSDYKGVDVKSGSNQDQPGSDGIYDSPYVINRDNRDRYPLVMMIPEFPFALALLLLIATASISIITCKKKWWKI